MTFAGDTRGVERLVARSIINSRIGAFWIIKGSLQTKINYKGGSLLLLSSNSATQSSSSTLHAPERKPAERTNCA